MCDTKAIFLMQQPRCALYTSTTVPIHKANDCCEINHVYCHMTTCVTKNINRCIIQAIFESIIIQITPQLKCIEIAVASLILSVSFHLRCNGSFNSSLKLRTYTSSKPPGISLGIGTANERRRYNITTSLIGWVEPSLTPEPLINPLPPVIREFPPKGQ